MNYEIAAKPVTYAGVRFRSMLEAKWAHLFDQIGMPWEYEPVMLDGWLPDFRLWGQFLVEVKPVAPGGFAMPSQDWEVLAKAVRTRSTILLGDGPGNNFGCLVMLDGDLLAASTFFYDPSQQYLMRTVRGDGGSDPQLDALQPHWRIASNAIWRLAKPEATGPRRCFGGQRVQSQTTRRARA